MRPVPALRFQPPVTPLGVLSVVRGEQSLFFLMLREAEEDERRAEQDRDDAGRVGPLVAVEERRLRRRRDLVRVLRILLARSPRRSSNDFVSWLSTLVGDLSLSGDAGDRRRDRGGVAGCQQRTEDRLHDRAAQVALEVRRARRHPRARAPAPSR